MAVTYVQSKLAYTGATTSTLVTDSSVTSGNFLVVFATSNGLGTSPSLSSSPAVTWTQFATVNDTTSPTSSVRAWWGVATSSGVMTLTITSPASDTGMHFWELNTGGQTPALDGTPVTKARSTDGRLASFTLTTANNSAFILSAISDERVADAGIGTLTGANQSISTSGNASASAVILNAGVAAGKPITWTWSVTNNAYAIVAAAFYIPRATFSDNFNRADGAIGTNYTARTGSFTVASNQFRISGPSDINCFTEVATSVATFSPDQSAKITLSALNSFDSVGVAVRSSATGAYVLRTDGASSSGRGLAKVVSGVTTSLGTVNLPACVAGDEIEIRALGTTVAMYRNGVLIDSVADTDLATGQPGLFYRRSNTGGSFGDNFVASDITVLPVNYVSGVINADPLNQRVLSGSLTALAAGSDTLSSDDSSTSSTAVAPASGETTETVAGTDSVTSARLAAGAVADTSTLSDQLGVTRNLLATSSDTLSALSVQQGIIPGTYSVLESGSSSDQLLGDVISVASKQPQWIAAVEAAQLSASVTVLGAQVANKYVNYVESSVEVIYPDTFVQPQYITAT